MLVTHLLLAASLALLFGGGVRVASRVTEEPLQRLIAGATLAASAAVIEALALGLVGLGTTPAVLFVAALATGLGAWRLAPRASVPVTAQLAAWWSGLPTWGRVAAGAIVGSWLAWTLWLLRFPAFDWDSYAYHLPEIVAWVRTGRPGAVLDILPGYPYGALPVTNEVLLSWGSGLGRSFVWITIWPALLLALLAAAGWAGLRALRVPRLPAGLAAASLCAAPMATSYQLNGPNSDFPALVWVVVAGALCAACVAERRDGLAAPALLACALAVGTKTTTAPQVGILLVVLGVHLRERLRALRLPLALAGAGAVVVGGIWYLRNLFDHGSPLWPFYRTPWGDPLPHLVGRPEQFTFFQRPLESLGRLSDAGYVKDTFLGPLVVLGGALLAPVFVRRRLVAAGALATAVAAFLWTFAPDTGAPLTRQDFPGAFYGSPRLLMPGVALATATVAVAARDGGRRGMRIWTALLAVALALNLWLLFGLGYPATPSPATPLLGAALGACLGLATAFVPWRWSLRPVALAGGVLAAGVALALAAPHLLDRHVRLGHDPRSQYLDAQLIPMFRQGAAADGRPIYSTPIAIALLAGDHLTRKVGAIPRREPCPRLTARARSGWVVVVKAITGEDLLGASTILSCVRSWRPYYQDPNLAVYRPRP